MDQIAKLVSGRLKAQLAGPHPSPDLLAAFVENALQSEEREKLLEHVGACSDCRQTLYLALPESAEAQRILSLQPNRRPALALRWGALVASLMILVVVFTTRYPSRRPVMQTATSPPAQIAAEKIPAEMDQIRALSSERRNEVPAKPTALPEAKHMTAKPQAKMDFDDSDQVRVSALPTLDQKKDLSVRSLPLAGRSVAALSALTAPGAQPASPPQPMGEPGKDKNSVGTTSSSLGMLAQESTVKGNLGGIILDPSGAVVGKAKITMVGPPGTKSATSDTEGRFSFDTLTPGSYSIKAEATGFKATEIKQVAVLDNRTSTIRVMLEPGTVSETVEVSAAAPVVDEPVAGSDAAPAGNSSTGFVREWQQTAAQLSVQKAAAANSRQRGLSSKAAVPVLRWTISPEGAVQRSFDAGKTWQTVSVAFGTVFRSLSAVGTQVWAGGNGGVLYHSADAGQNWAKVVPAAGGKKLDQDIVHLDFSDPLSGTINAANGEVWATSNGGQTWLRK